MTIHPVSGSSSGRLAPVLSSARKLHALFSAEWSLVRTLPLVTVRVGDIELKYLLAQHAWEAAEHARFLQERGGELRGFPREDKADDRLHRVFEEALRAPSGEAAISGFYEVIKDALLAAYRQCLAETEPLGDWSTSQLLKEFIRDEERHGEEIAPYLASYRDDDWNAHLSTALASLGGISQTLPVPVEESSVQWLSETPYVHPAWPARGTMPAGRIHGEDPADCVVIITMLSDPATDPRVARIMTYVWLWNELPAVESLATIIYDTPHGSFALHHDLVRHLWDEARHSQFGYRGLPRQGIDLASVEMSVFEYQAMIALTPAERYALLTMIWESATFAIKAPVIDGVQSLGDFETETLLAFDRNDEQNHVRYGHRWLPALMQLENETRPIPQFLEALQAKYEHLEPEVRQQLDHTLPQSSRLTVARMIALVNS